ncbi:hypothetical protein [uncultured Limosilactobacillus sp.]|uniref:hypothetical protein n=1 Tax=uncultured Limosilactobacillus sp. TaxID=2837629 RepID=UPI0025D13BF9|nr:hypothetical protein [uncultured Limosilactobacillus sp.]
MKLLAPNYLQLAMENTSEYQMAKKLLYLDWPEDPNQLFHNQVTPAIVKFARALQESKLIRGRIDLGDYQAVSQLVGMHDRWFSLEARHELLKRFE